MNKNELVGVVVEKTGLTRAKATETLEEILGAVQDALKKGDDVRLVGFGTFSISNRAATTGRNPQTGARISISAYKQPRFRPGKRLKDALNGR